MLSAVATTGGIVLIYFHFKIKILKNHYHAKSKCAVNEDLLPACYAIARLNSASFLSQRFLPDSPNGCRLIILQKSCLSIFDKDFGRKNSNLEQKLLMIVQRHTKKSFRCGFAWCVNDA